MSPLDDRQRRNLMVWGQLPETPERLLTATDLATRWQVSTAHVYRLAREGTLPVVKIGRYRRFRLDAVKIWEQGHFEPWLTTILKWQDEPGVTRLPT